MTFPRAYRWIVAGLLIVACSSQPLPDGERPSIVCEAVTEQQTKGTGETTTTTLQSSGIGLFAWHTYEGTAYSSEATPYLTNRSFTYESNSGTWKGSAFWPLGSWLSFFAYAPYHEDVTSGSFVFPSGTSNGYPTASYTVATVPGQQEDLVLAAPVINRSYASGNVPLVFSHALTRVVFKARWTGEDPFVRRVVSQGLGVRITSIALENVRGNSTVYFYNGGYNWDSPAANQLSTYATQTYSLNVQNGSLKALNQSGAAISQVPTYSDAFLSSAGEMYLIPQTLATGAILRVTYGIYRSGDQLEEEFEAAFQIGLLNQHIWPAGGEFIYSITLSLGGAPSVEATAGEYRNSTLPGSEVGRYIISTIEGSTCGAYQNGSPLEDES